MFDFSKQPGQTKLDLYDIRKCTPLITVITPYYNAGKYFEQTFNSVINQTFPYFEWIIVDDGSAPEETDFLRGWAEKDPRIILLRKENGGIASARHLAFEKSHTEYIMNIDADDLMDPTALECLYWAFEHNPDADFIYMDSIGFQDQEYVWRKTFDSGIMKKENLLTANSAIKRSSYFAAGGYDLDKKHQNEDWILWMKMLAKGMKPVHLALNGTWYRRTDSGVLSIVKKNKDISARTKKALKEINQNVSPHQYAKEYPAASRAGSFIRPKASGWTEPFPFKKRKKHILLIFPWLVMGGADVFNLDIVSRMDPNQYAFSIVTTVPSGAEWRQRFEEHVPDIFDLTTFCDLADWPEFIHYLITSRQIDLVFLSNSYYGYYLLPWLRKEFPDIPIVDYVHMESWYWRNGGFARTTGALQDITEKTYVCNEHLRQLLIDAFGRKPESVQTLYIGVDTERFQPDPEAGQAMRAQYGIPKDAPVILFPCRIEGQKRPYLMLEIARRVRQSFPEVVFLIVGDGPDLKGIQKTARKHRLTQNLVFIGRSDDMPALYNAADITLICSLKEGLSLTSYESLATGTPVVSSDVGGQSELVGSDVGRLIPLLQDETEDFARKTFSDQEIGLYVDAIKELLADDRHYRRLCENCRQKMQSGFSKAAMVSSMEQAFDSFIGSGTASRGITAAACRSLGSMTDDYLSLYCEYEYPSLSSGQGLTYAQLASIMRRLQRLADTWIGRIAKKVYFKIFRG